jgi:predicted nucleic acid-binding protein
MVDTSVFLRWFVPQAGWEHAREVRGSFVAGTVALETIDSVRVELGHVLRTKGVVAGRLTRDQYLAAVRTVDDLGLVVHATDVDALDRAAALAADRNLRLFDALIVDRALERDLPLLTSDAKLCRGVEGLLSTELLRGAAAG